MNSHARVFDELADEEKHSVDTWSDELRPPSDSVVRLRSPFMQPRVQMPPPPRLPAEPQNAVDDGWLALLGEALATAPEPAVTSTQSESPSSTRSGVGASERPNGRSLSPRAVLLNQADSIFVEIDMPGLGAADLDVSVAHDVLVVSAEVPRGAPPDFEAVELERPRGRLERRLKLLSAVDTEDVSAVMEAGVLQITLKKIETDAPSRMPVREIS